MAYGFIALISVGAVLLRALGDVGWIDAVFTATSAVCVTGLATVDPATQMGFDSQVVIGVLAQLGGFGIMTFAGLAGLTLSGRVGMGRRLAAAAEIGALDLGDLRRVVIAVAKVTVVVEVAVAAVLALRFLVDGASLGRALGWGSFHAVSAWNNAGFSVVPGGLVAFRDDVIVNLTVMAAVVVGGLGTPVLLDLRDRKRAVRWSLHTKLALVTTVGLLAVGFVVTLAVEWANARTFGPLPVGEKVLAASFAAVTPRTAGFNTVDYAGMHDATLMFTSVLMLIGGGAASTAGGIKVTTLAVILGVLWSEARGRRDVALYGRTVPEPVQREAVTIGFLALMLAAVGAMVLSGVTPFALRDVIFEAVSAIGTVGLSTGVTPLLPETAKMVLVLLMFAGRLGPLAFATALALRGRDRSFRYPEERPLLG